MRKFPTTENRQTPKPQTNKTGTSNNMRKQKRTQVIEIKLTTFDDIKALRRLKKQGYRVQEIGWTTATLTK
jgi:hypothetical protein